MTDHIQTRPTAIETRVPARYYLRMADLLASEGVDVAALLHAVGLRPASLQLPDATLTLAQLETLLAAVMTHRPDSALPFHLGRSLKPSAHSLVGYGMLSSPTVDHALRFVARYFRLVMPTFRMRYRSGGGRAELLFEPVQPMSSLNLHFHIETIAVAAHHEVHDLLAAPMPPHRISLSIPEPPHVALYARLDNARCHFLASEAPSVRLQFEVDFSRHTPAMADHSALRAAEAQCRSLLRGQRGQHGVANWTRMMLREAHGGIPQISDLASTLNRSPRTLDRYLQREGLGFRAMAMTQRMERAHELLIAGDLSITEIALELGYSDASNFTRAFRRHFGEPPKRHRAGAPNRQESAAPNP